MVLDTLSDRKMQILQAIVMNYLQTAEPVGSRTISRQTTLGLSSATIRNEMADLEELGLILQPHTSAGRIPSSKGYRVYVNHLLSDGYRPGTEEARALTRLISSKSRQLDEVLKEMGEILSALTRYPTVVTMPLVKKTKLKHLQLIPLDEQSAVLVIITDGNIVRNETIKVPRDLSQKECDHFSSILNYYLRGLTIEEINLPVIHSMQEAMGMEQGLVNEVLEAIHTTFQYADDVELYANGVNSILEFPEFSDVGRARELMSLFDRKEEILSAIGDVRTMQDGQNFRIVIGNENEMQSMQDCSVVTTSITVGGHNVGSISVIGPVRMDYGRVFSSLGSILQDFRALRLKQEGRYIWQLPQNEESDEL